MSRSIEVFCQDDLPISEICQSIADMLSITFAARTIEGVGTVHEAKHNHVFISAYKDHGLVDDCGIEFTKYSTQINFHGRVPDETLIKYGKVIAEGLARQLGCTTIVVANLQQLKATFLSTRGTD